MRFPILKIRYQPNLTQTLEKVFQSGWIGTGPKTEEFSSVFSHYINRPCIMLNSCTSALHLAFEIVAQKFDTVLMPSISCFATASAAIQAGLKIQWVDIDPRNLLIDQNDLVNKFCGQAICLVDFGGRSCEINFDTFIVEDCAHAFGKTNNNNDNTFYCYSFQSVKTLTTGDGGALVPPSTYFHLLEKLSWYGMDRNKPRDQDIELPGFKYAMNDIAAAIGLENFSLALEDVNRQRKNAQYYHQNLSNFDGIQLPDYCDMSTYWLFSLLIERRQDFIRHLQDHGIESNPLHYRNDQKSCLKEYQTELPNTDFIANRLTNIPNGWWIDAESREFIVDIIKRGW